MGTPAKIRHGVCIFTLIGLLNGQVMAAGTPTSAALLMKAASSSALIPSPASENEKVVTFAVTQHVIVATKADDSQRLELQPGDVIDAAFDIPDAPASSSGSTAEGEEGYIKGVLSASPQNQLLMFKINSSSNSANEGKTVFLKPEALAAMSLQKDADVGETIGETTDESADGGSSDMDDSDDNMSEIGSAPGAISSGPIKVAPARAGEPLMKPGMPNLSKVVDQTFARYSSSRQVSRLVTVGVDHIYTVNQHGKKSLRYVKMEVIGKGKHKHTHRQPMCWRSVKDALIAAGLVQSGFAANSGYAFQARQLLLQQGFRDLLADPRTRSVMLNPNMAPKGAIMVYADSKGTDVVVRTKHGVIHKLFPGHVEIKTAASGQAGYVSINQQTRPAYGEFAEGKRRLIGVMVRDT